MKSLCQTDSGGFEVQHMVEGMKTIERGELPEKFMLWCQHLEFCRRDVAPFFHEKVNSHLFDGGGKCCLRSHSRILHKCSIGFRSGD